MSLSFDAVSVTYDGEPVVHRVSLDVPTGSFVGLLGPNGSGKSTLLSTAYRAHRPAAGSVRLDGEDLLAMPARSAARRLAVMAQESSVEFDLDVGEMVALGRTPHQRGFRRDREADREAIGAALERVGCAALVRRSFATLSGGEKQRVLLARALAQEADHLILDEPTNHLDIRYQIEALELVSGLGLTVLAAIHDLSLASLFCDSLTLLSAGRVVATGTPAEVLTVERVRETYGAEVFVVPHPGTSAPQILGTRSPRSAAPDRGTSAPFPDQGTHVRPPDQERPPRSRLRRRAGRAGDRRARARPQ